MWFVRTGFHAFWGAAPGQDEKDVTPEWLTAALHKNATIPATVKVRGPDGGAARGHGRAQLPDLRRRAPRAGPPRPCRW